MQPGQVFIPREVFGVPLRPPTKPLLREKEAPAGYLDAAPAQWLPLRNYSPVEPKPPSPRSDSPNFSATSQSTAA